MKRATRDQLCTSFSAKNPPVLQVQLGEPFVMETNDRFATYEGPNSSSEAMEILTTMAGPVYIEGAKPGDTLKIEVLDVALPLDYGWIGATPGRGPLGARIPAFRKARVRITPEGVVFNDYVTIPLRPMIGRIGVAPKEESKRSNDKGVFGGGMGNTQITTGSTVYLPVFHAGGLLTIGDCHAAMGDGEATASAVECALDATFRVTVEERFTVSRPVVTTATEVMTTGEGETMEAATKLAIQGMADLLVDTLEIDDTAAAMLIACAADVRTGLAGHPPYTMAWPSQRLCSRCKALESPIVRAHTTWVHGVDEAPCGPVMGTRGDAGTPAGAAARGAGTSASGTTTVAASASATPSRWARAVRERVGASPRVRSAASSASKRTCIH